MSDKLDSWMKSGRYLPAPLRDFHDQKDTFKAIHEIYCENESAKEINWRQAHCYVIDMFLWFMARRGYTLQKTRTKLEFRDLESDVKAQKEARNQMYLNAMKAERPKP